MHVASGGDLAELYDKDDDDMQQYIEWSFFQHWGAFADLKGGDAWRVWTLCRTHP